MKNFVSPNSHPSSFFSGSTLEAMIDKSKELGTGYYTCTDNGYLTNTLKAYNYAKKQDIKLIAGCEIYIVEDDITKDTKAERIKYYTITLHAKNQDAYQFLVKKISEKDRPTITIVDHEYPTFTWADLEEFGQRPFTASTGGPQDFVCKNLLVNEPSVAVKIFQRLHSIFGENFYASILPYSFDKKWKTISVFTLTNGETVQLDSNIMAETEYAKTFQVSLEEVANKPEKHKAIKRIYVNGIGYNVNKNILSACNLKDFKPIGTDIYEKYNKFTKLLCDRLGVKTLINDYSYMADSGDKLVQNLKLGEEMRFYTNNYMHKTDDVMSILKTTHTDSEIEQLVQNSYDWASQFNEFNLKYDYRLVNEHDDTLQATMDIVKKIGRFDASNEEHRKRLRHEIDVIHSNGEIDLLPYFFPISKVINHYTDNGRIVGPARGSAGGSFLMYCMGITQTDPLKYGLFFSRFLTLGRILKGTLPDVDVDLPDRDLLVGDGGFLETHYPDRWAQISTRTLMKLKSSIRDVNRFKKGKVEDEIERLAKNLEPTPQGITDQEFVFGYEEDEAHVPGLLDMDENLLNYTRERPEEWEIVKRTLGIARQNGRHPCAFVISDIPVSHVIPTFKVAGVENITQYEAKEVEAAGLNKYDFLVVKCLNDLELAIDYINKKYRKDTGSIGSPDAGVFWHKGDQLYIWDLPEEQEVFDTLSNGKTETIFQLNTVSVTPYVQKIKPKSVEDCAVITSLVRPGPLNFIDKATGRNMAEEYIERVNGRSRGDIEILDRLLPETHGVFVFQEQITKITKELTGWDDEKAEDIRIAVGKKLQKMISELKPQFLKAAAEKEIVDVITAQKIWAMMETFGGYGFNKSHAVGYAQIAYACAYLKHHYKLEWWAAVLSNADEKEITEVLWPHVKDILSPPDINLSNEEMVIDYKHQTIRNKLSALRGLGPKVADKITSQRPYVDIKDFVRKKAAGAALTRKLIHVGVMDSLFEKELNLMEKMQYFENAVEENAYKNKMVEKSNGEIDINLPIDKFITVAKGHPLTKRCKHVVKEGKIDTKYIFMDPIKDFTLKKSIFPTMPMDLTDIIRENAENVQIINTQESDYAINSLNREVRLVNGKMYQRIKNLPHQPGSQKSVNFCMACYVVEAKEFAYKNGSRKALRLIVDIDGHLEEFVQWPDYETGELSYPEGLNKNSVIFLFMYKKLGKEIYHTNISSIVVENIGFK